MIRRHDVISFENLETVAKEGCFIKGSVYANYDSNPVAKTTTSIQTHYPLTSHYLLLQKFASPAFLLISTCRRFLQVCGTAAWKDGEPLLRLGILMITHGERKERKTKTWDWTVTWREMQQLEHMLISLWNQNKRAAYLWRTVCLRVSSLINNIVTSTGTWIERKLWYCFLSNIVWVSINFLYWFSEWISHSWTNLLSR